MHYFDSTIIDGNIYLHQVGNKQNGEPLILAKSEVDIDDTARKELKRFFFLTLSKVSISILCMSQCCH